MTLFNERESRRGSKAKWITVPSSRTRGIHPQANDAYSIFTLFQGKNSLFSFLFVFWLPSLLWPWCIMLYMYWAPLEKHARLYFTFICQIWAIFHVSEAFNYWQEQDACISCDNVLYSKRNVIIWGVNCDLLGKLICFLSANAFGGNCPPRTHCIRGHPFMASTLRGQAQASTCRWGCQLHVEIHKRK